MFSTAVAAPADEPTEREELPLQCAQCTSRRLTTIVVRLAPEEEHLFASCHGCEWRGWFKEGSAVPLQRVLSLASERRF
jgi:hypothetical protein